MREGTLCADWSVYARRHIDGILAGMVDRAGAIEGGVYAPPAGFAAAFADSGAEIAVRLAAYAILISLALLMRAGPSMISASPPGTIWTRPCSGRFPASPRRPASPFSSTRIRSRRYRIPSKRPWSAPLQKR